MNPEPTPLLSREQGLQPTATRYAYVHLPRGVMRMRSISDLDRIAFELAEMNEEGEVDMAQIGRRRARTVVLAAVDGNGKALFHEKDVETIAAWDSRELKQAYVACSEHCGLNDAEVERFGKNFERARVSASL